MPSEPWLLYADTREPVELKLGEKLPPGTALMVRMIRSPLGAAPVISWASATVTEDGGLEIQVVDPVTPARSAFDAQLRVFEEMRGVYLSAAPWETKYDLVLRSAKELRRLGIDPNYYDPDTTYEEDTRACYRAFAAAMVDLAHAFRVQLDDGEE